LRFVSAAQTKDNSLYVFYFSSGATADITVMPGKTDDSIRWFNPRSGEWQTHRQPTPPDSQDWVLVLRR
jgi:hypothetical protein